jgi:hypothetical protein
MGRRGQIRDFLSAMAEGQKAIKSHSREAQPATVRKHLGDAAKLLDGVQAGKAAGKGLEALGGLLKAHGALTLAGYKKASKTLVGAAEDWCKAFEKACDLGEIEGWVEHQAPRVVKTASLEGWFTASAKKGYPVGKPTKGKKATKKAPAKGKSKSEPKAEEVTLTKVELAEMMAEVAAKAVEEALNN